ncbi:MAG: DUF1302 family protein [Spirochaetia bacterium]|nr:DUF1302 family protein [Spirochaetia bacterium]
MRSLTYINKRNLIGSLVLLTAMAMLMPNMLFAKDIDFSGMLRSYTGARLSEGDVPITEQTADVKMEGWGEDTHIMLNPYAYIGADGEPEIGMREAYLDLYFPSMDIRVGKQAIVWGEAEGAFITDIVSPQDLRSFILADFTEIRMGVPAVKADYFAGPLTFEAVWLPRFIPTELPDQSSIWYTDQMNMMSVPELPSDDLENSELFGKVSYFGAAFNGELMAGYAWDDNPVLEGSAPNPDASYQRYTVVGGSFSTTLGSVVLRSEAAAYLNKAFTSLENPGTPLAAFATSDYHQLHGLAGLDWSLFGVDMSSQYILQYIHDYDAALMSDEYDHTLTFRMRDSNMAQTLTWELFTYVGFDPEDIENSTDALLRPSLTYSIEDGVEIQSGVEIFLGDEAGNFGKYEDNTMAYVSLRWYF